MILLKTWRSVILIRTICHYKEASVCIGTCNRTPLLSEFPTVKKCLHVGASSQQSTVFLIPLVLFPPVTIQGKIVLRKLMTESVNWDQPLSEEYRQEWETWRTSLTHLEHVNIS